MRASTRTIEYKPYESLTQILSEFSLHRSDDLYRRGYPRDITGMNLFQATLKRLDNFQTLNPTLYADVVAVTRGQLQERLGNYAAASAAYTNLGPNPSEEMQSLAAQNLDRVTQIAAAVNRPLDSTSLSRYLADLEFKRNDLTALAQQLQGSPYESLARIEAEKADIERVILLFNSRYVTPDGLNESLREATALLERHKDSFLLLQHQILIADFHSSAAHEYAALHNPERSDFDSGQFNGLIDPARDLYFRVSQKDGAPEKLEARAKLQAVEAFARRVEMSREPAAPAGK